MSRSRVLPELLLVALLCIVAVLPSRFVAETVPSGWGGFHYVRIAVVVAAVALALLTFRERSHGEREALPLENRLLRALLIVHVSLVAVLLGKYLLGAIPATWSHDVIQYYSAIPSLVDLYEPKRALAPPIVTPIYPPGTFAVADALEPVLGEGRHVLRFVSVAGVLLSALMIGKVVSRDHGWGWGLAGGALFLAVFPQMVWSGAPTKPEYLAVGLSLAGIAVVSGPAGERVGNLGRIVGAGVLFGAALLVKFTVAAGVGGACLYLVLKRRWRQFVVLGATTVVVFGGTYLLLSHATDGGLVFFTLLSNMLEPDLQKAFRFGIMTIGQSFFVILCVTLAMVRLASLRETEENDVEALVAVATLVAVGLGIATTARPLSSPNYVLEAVALGVLLVALALPTDTERTSGMGKVGVSALMGVFLAIHLPSQVALLARDFPPPSLPTSVIDQLDSSADGYVLSDPRFVPSVLDAGREPLVLDSYHITMMIERGAIDARVVTGPMLDGRVPFAVLSDDPEEEGRGSVGRKPHASAVIEVLRDMYRCRTHGEAGVVLCRWAGKKGTRTIE